MGRATHEPSLHPSRGYQMPRSSRQELCRENTASHACAISHTCGACMPPGWLESSWKPPPVSCWMLHVKKFLVTVHMRRRDSSGGIMTAMHEAIRPHVIESTTCKRHVQRVSSAVASGWWSSMLSILQPCPATQCGPKARTTQGGCGLAHGAPNCNLRHCRVVADGR